MHAAKGVCPAPGPCKNHRLIVWDDELKKWVGRPGILMATSSREGDYRRVTKETWLKFCEFYPGCEPTIKMIFHPDELNSVGQYPLETFEILDPPEPPLEPKKRRIFRLRKSVDSDEEKNDDVDTSLLTETRKDKPVLTNQPDSSTKRKTSMDGSPKVEYSAVPDTASERSNTERTSKLSQPKKTDAVRLLRLY